MACSISDKPVAICTARDGNVITSLAFFLLQSAPARGRNFTDDMLYGIIYMWYSSTHPLGDRGNARYVAKDYC